MLLSLLLFESEFLHIVAISYTALVINELIMVALEITTWHSYMILSEVGTGVVYFGSMLFLPEYFGESAIRFLYLDGKLRYDRSVIRIYISIRL
jgi:phospholipid-translocating ATPase